MKIPSEYQDVAGYGFIRPQSINLAPLMRGFLFMLPNHRLKLAAHLAKILSVRRTSGGGIAKAVKYEYDNTYGIEYEKWGALWTGSI